MLSETGTTQAPSPYVLFANSCFQPIVEPEGFITDLQLQIILDTDPDRRIRPKKICNLNFINLFQDCTGNGLSTIL
jgi:hypothetical protein